MLDTIIKAIFWIIGKIGDIVLLPIMAVISALVPDLSVNLDNITNFLQYGFNYVVFFFKTLMIPSTCIQMVVLVFTLYLSIIVGVRSYQFIMRIYNHFKT